MSGSLWNGDDDRFEASRLAYLYVGVAWKVLRAYLVHSRLFQSQGNPTVNARTSTGLVRSIHPLRPDSLYCNLMAADLKCSPRTTDVRPVVTSSRVWQLLRRPC